jgi:hypothetical protein
MRRIVFISILLFLTTLGFGQKSIQDTAIRFFAISAEIGLQNGFGDLGDRYGYGGIAGGSFLYKSASNYTLEANYGFFFGNIVKEDSILNSLRTENGDIIGKDGGPADVFLYQRGFVSTVRIGKVFPIIGPNPNSGLHVALGGGIMQHKIKIIEVAEQVPQLLGEYKKGYDHLTYGFTLSQSIGYQHFSNYRLLNFYVGAEFYEGFTQNRRSINFNTKSADPTQRLDVLATLVLRWYFPLYKRQASDFYFY